MTLPYELHLALRYLRFHRGRTFLSVITMISVAGVTVGTAALVIALALMTGFEQDVRERIVRGSAHLTVMSSGETPFKDAEAVADRVRAVPGVRACGLVVYSPGMILNESRGISAFSEIEGVDPAKQGRVVDLGQAGGDPFGPLGRRTESGRDGIVLGYDLADKLGVRAGDPVRILVPRVRLTPFAPIPKSQVFEVVGTFRAEAYPQDAQRAYMGIESARRLLDAPKRAHWVEVRLVGLERLQAMKTSIGEALGPSWLVLDLIEQNQPILKALNTEKFILFLAIALIVVVAALNIVSTLILMVTDKIKEIGTLTAMGAKPAGIAAVFMSQGVVIGLVGTVVGLGLGLGVSVWLDRYKVIKLNPDVYFINHVPFTPTVMDLIFVGGVTLAVSFLATLYPAWRAARLDPVEAIRYE